MVIGPQGFVKPLCDTCSCRDCSNSIEKMNVSIFGVTKKVKVLNKGVNPSFVVQCEGYLK